MTFNIQPIQPKSNMQTDLEHRYENAFFARSSFLLQTKFAEIFFPALIKSHLTFKLVLIMQLLEYLI